MNLIPFASLAVLLAAAAPAQSDKTANVENSSTQAAKVEKADKDGKKVCRLFRNTGSNISDRICLTKEEWAQVEEELRD